MKNFNLSIWVSDHIGKPYECKYPHKFTATNEESLKKYVAKDHVFICFKNNYRSEENFQYADSLELDCDNDFSENEADWITPEKVKAAFPSVTFIVYTSRHHMKWKDSKSPRPRFHVIFFIERINDPDEYKELIKMVQEYFPYFDKNAQDAARFFFGNPDAIVTVFQNVLNLSQFFDVDEFAKLDREIREGSRNSTMFKWAVRSMVRYGDTKESHDCFHRQALNCSPPLDDSELDKIWSQAKKYYKKISSKPGYVKPDVYNGKIDARWVEPIPFSSYVKEPFPVDALPMPIAEYVKAVSESTQTPLDMAGALSIAVMSTCLQGKFRIRGKSDWYEPLNTYVLAIAPPSERKSAVMKLMLKPVNDYEQQYNNRNSALVESSKMQKRILERRQKAIEDQMAKGKAEQADLDRIVQEITQFEEITPMHLYVDDITTEKLVSVLAENKGHASLISSEGGIFDTLAGIYTKNVNIDVMLKGYSGDPIRVDRIGRESECINDPTLTVLLMAQPNVVSEVLSNGTFRGRGLTARFLYCMPDSFVGARMYYSEPISNDLYYNYERCVIDLLEDDYSKKPETISLSPEADMLLADFAQEIEPKLVKEYADIADWVGKLIGNTLRIAGLLCRAGGYRCHDFLDVPDPLTVSGETMQNAIMLGRYFLNHAQAAYSVLPEDAIAKQANVILNMIFEKKLTKFDRRDAMRSCRSFKTAAEIQPILDLLDDYGYIMQLPEKNKGAGRPPLPKYAVNPRILKE